MRALDQQLKEKQRMPDPPSNPPADELSPEQAREVVKAIEDIEKEEAEEQTDE